MIKTRDELEFAISQYLDGTLSPLELPQLEEKFASDADARALLGEYQRLNHSLRDAMPLPEIEWNDFSNRVRDAVAAEEVPTKHYRMGGWKIFVPLALAAGVAIVVSVGLRNGSTQSKLPKDVGVAMISGPRAEQSQGTSVAEVSIGPSPTLANNWRAGQEVVDRPSVVLIDRAVRADGEQSVY